MDIDLINAGLTAVSTVGFPIAACVIMFKYMNKEQENHKAEVDSLKDVISKNNSILAELKQLLQDKLS